MAKQNDTKASPVVHMQAGDIVRTPDGKIDFAASRAKALAKVAPKDAKASGKGGFSDRTTLDASGRMAAIARFGNIAQRVLVETVNAALETKGVVSAAGSESYFVAETMNRLFPSSGAVSGMKGESRGLTRDYLTLRCRDLYNPYSNMAPGAHKGRSGGQLFRLTDPDSIPVPSPKGTEQIETLIATGNVPKGGEAL